MFSQSTLRFSHSRSQVSSSFTHIRTTSACAFNPPFILTLTHTSLITSSARIITLALLFFRLRLQAAQTASYSPSHPPSSLQSDMHAFGSFPTSQANRTTNSASLSLCSSHTALSPSLATLEAFATLHQCQQLIQVLRYSCLSVYPCSLSVSSRLSSSHKQGINAAIHSSRSLCQTCKGELALPQAMQKLLAHLPSPSHRSPPRFPLLGVCGSSTSSAAASRLRFEGVRLWRCCAGVRLWLLRRRSRERCSSRAALRGPRLEGVSGCVSESTLDSL